MRSNATSLPPSESKDGSREECFRREDTARTTLARARAQRSFLFCSAQARKTCIVLRVRNASSLRKLRTSLSTFGQQANVSRRGNGQECTQRRSEKVRNLRSGGRRRGETSLPKTVPNSEIRARVTRALDRPGTLFLG